MLKRQYTVIKKVSGSPKSFRKWDEWSVGDIVIGKFVGYHQDQYKKNCTIVEVEEVFFKKSKEDYKGKHLVLNSCGKLDKAMQKIAEGTLIQVEYMGKDMIEKGPYAGKDAHNVDVAEIELSQDADCDDL